MISIVRLGIRLAFSGGRTSAVALAITALAIAAGTAVVLFALSFQPALDARYTRSAWRNAVPVADPASRDRSRDLLISSREDRFDGQPITRIDVAALGANAPIAPGIAAWPKAGEALVSPALRELMANTPADQLADRFGRVTGTLGEVGLRSPNELAVIVGMAPDVLRLRQPTLVNALDTHPTLPKIDFVVILMVVIAAIGALAPVVVFVATATRLNAAGRERRLALLRLLGATPSQMQLLAAGETLVALVPGAILGALLFLVTRPLVAGVQVDQSDWFVDAIVPPLGLAALTLLGVPLLGVAAALLSLRRIRVSPLGVVRQQRGKAPSRGRLVPLGVALIAFLVAVVLAQDPNGRSQLAIILIALSFFGLVVGLAIAGPWLTGQLGRVLGRVARGPVGLLASRRLTDAPSGAFGAISGVVLAVFVASAFSVLIGFANGNLGRGTPLPLATGTVVGEVGSLLPKASATTPALLAEVAAAPGVRAVAGIRDVMLVTANGDSISGWIANCVDVAATLDLSVDCGAAKLWAAPNAIVDPADRLSVTGGYLFGLADTDPRVPKPEALPASFAHASFGVDSAPASAADATTPVSGFDAYYQLPNAIVDPTLLPDAGVRFPLSRVLVATDGTAATAERVRTLIERDAPGTTVMTLADIRTSSLGVLGEAGRIVALGTLGTLIIAGCSLAVSVAAGLMDRRRPLALLRMTGMPLGRLRATVLVEAAAPLFVTAIVSAVLGVAAGEVLLKSIASVPVPAPDAWLVPVLGGGLLAAMLVVAATLPLLGRVTSTEQTRFE